ncbi:hypothetical protein I4U23_004160 [Adineta vaga]|nr:hypothetical protein I4U23_004160 [Adineta vaga]
MKYSSELTGAIGQLVCVLLLFIGNNKISGRTISNVRTDYSYEHLLTLSTCLTIQDRISRASEVFFPSDERYFQGIHHHTWSSSALSVCSVEPGISADVAIIMQLIRERRVPFGIKGGGHATNPNFSSTTGIHIVMRRLNSITFDSQEQTVRLGAGLVWLEVYKFLEPYNVTVNGGREGTAGVAGVTLGGGYGWKTNQYGLTMDSVIEYELVTPSGTIVHVNKNSYPDIFFGLKGGYNNFGIVTNFKMHVVPQRQIYGGILTYSIDNSTKFDRFINAAVNFQKNNQDARAQIELVFYIESGVLTIRLSAIYDGPSAPEHIYKEFVDIDHIGN